MTPKLSNTAPFLSNIKQAEGRRQKAEGRGQLVGGRCRSFFLAAAILFNCQYSILCIIARVRWKSNKKIKLSKKTETADFAD
jgi:hypothetical protein